MATKKTAAKTAAPVAEEKGTHTIDLPNGQKRIEFIRDRYYNAKTHKHGEGEATRGQIKTEINEMLTAAGREDEQIPYQIVFAATKTEEDPRVASQAAAKARAEAKEAKAKAAKEEKAAAAKAAPAKKGK